MAAVHEMLCEICEAPAACIGCYDADEFSPACDACCGHGNEDGCCIRCTADEPCQHCEDGAPCAAIRLLTRPRLPEESDVISS